ncbi:hypothetical protein B9G39_21705 [Zooshikella ganghwensis]|uniref:Uncharacterized protein n=1 Tax=Zooshikella ganghwensis TaxID=202772 RepID=A0A4P9VTT2_9GAMM|nr:hypothetical protein B9G39_21705 [Zooshikella ganghwensis]
MILSLTSSPSCDEVTHSEVNRNKGFLKIVSLTTDVNNQLREWELNAFDTKFDPTKMQLIGVE